MPQPCSIKFGILKTSKQILIEINTDVMIKST